MKYLYRPNANEELSVQGHYVVTAGSGAVVAREDWERWRVDGADAEIWRAEWRPETGVGGLLAHALVTADGLERLKVRVTGREQPALTLSLIPEPHGVMLSQEGLFQEVALPPVFGIVTPFWALARLALPFDLALEGRQLAMTYLLRPLWESGSWHHRPTKFAYFPVEMREVEVRGQNLKGKGWRMGVPGLADRSLWFDRNGILLAGEVADDPVQRIVLEKYRTFG